MNKNYIEGIHPTTGEILKVSVTGNFPFKDPVTNEFIVDEAGQIILPGRERERFARLDASRQEISDPRPMSSAVAFAPDVTPEQEVLRLIASSDARMLANYERASQSDQEFFDDDDFSVPEEGGVDNMTSPFEFVRDLVAGKEVPRALKGSFIRTEAPVPEAKEAPPLPPSGKAAKRSKKASDDHPELPFPEEDGEGGQ